jgi:hypothetical protein
MHDLKTKINSRLMAICHLVAGALFGRVAFKKKKEVAFIRKVFILHQQKLLYG